MQNTSAEGSSTLSVSNRWWEPLFLRGIVYEN
jgi:hypothetical protein